MKLLGTARILYDPNSLLLSFRVLLQFEKLLRFAFESDKASYLAAAAACRCERFKALELFGKENIICSQYSLFVAVSSSKKSVYSSKDALKGNYGTGSARDITTP